MLNLDERVKQTVKSIIRDKNEDDKILIHVERLAHEAIQQHAVEIMRLKKRYGTK